MDKRSRSSVFVLRGKDLTTGRILNKYGDGLGQALAINNPDQLRLDYGASAYALTLPNQAPMISSVANTVAQVGQAYRYQAQAADADSQAGTALGYLLLNAPVGMSIDQQTGLISWTPTKDSNVISAVSLRVYDSHGAYVDSEFVVQVAGGNHSPVFRTVSTEIQGREGQKLELSLAATDADRSTLSYWAENLPGGAKFSAKTGVLIWTPDATSTGTYDVKFYVSDGVEVVEQA
jgi:hypothetical protein